MTSKCEIYGGLCSQEKMAEQPTSSQAVMGWSIVFLFLLVAVPAAAQKPPAVVPTKAAMPAPHSRKAKSTTHTEPESLAIPDSIKLDSGEVIPVAEIIPRAEAAQKQLQQILAQLGASDIETLTSSLNDLNSKVGESLKDTQNAIRFASSPLQLTEPRIVWTRDRSELESLGTAATADTAMLEELRQQARGVSETWDKAATAAVAAKLPDELLQRIEEVRKIADSARAALHDEANKLIQLQVQISETRTKIGGVIDQISAADAALRAQLWMLDSPPLWSAQRNSTWPEMKQQIGEYFAAASSRSSRFFQSYRSQLLLYGILSVAILALMIRICRRDLSTEETGIDSHYFACLQHPIAITALIMLAMFRVVFPKVPSDVLRFTRMLMVVPVVLIGFSFVERRMRPYLLAATGFFVVNMLALAFLGGTLLRRLVLLLLTASLLAGLVNLLRKGGMLRGLFADRQAALMLICSYVAILLLLVATLANIFGNMSLARLLGDGTIIVIYWAIALYVLCAVFTALTAVFTASDFGRRSRALRLHSELVNRKVAVYLKFLNWALWIFTILLAFQLSTKALAAAREVLRHEWKVGALSLSPLDIVLFFLVLTVSNMIARFTRFMLDEEILPRTTVDSGVAQAGTRLTYIALLILGMIFALGAAGLELSKLTLLTGAFGVGLGFGLQNVVGNFVSGIIISLERPMKIGDLIEVSTLFGEVTDIGFRSSTVHTFEGADVIVPNSEFITKSFVNWSLKDKLRRTDIQIGVAYGTDPNCVLEILTRIVTSHAGVLRSVAPLITFDQFGESSLNFTVRFWSKMDDRLQIRSELNVLINDEFEKNGIVIPFPQRDVHVKLEGDVSNLVLAQEKTTKGAIA